MPKRDPELIAIERVLTTLENLDRPTQMRVLNYVGQKLDADLRYDHSELMGNMAQAFQAINSASRQLGVSGIELISTIIHMYEEAKPTTEESDA